jgi:hypothetical protein
VNMRSNLWSSSEKISPMAVPAARWTRRRTLCAYKEGRRAGNGGLNSEEPRCGSGKEELQEPSN